MTESRFARSQPASAVAWCSEQPGVTEGSGKSVPARSAPLAAPLPPQLDFRRGGRSGSEMNTFCPSISTKWPLTFASAINLIISSSSIRGKRGSGRSGSGRASITMGSTRIGGRPAQTITASAASAARWEVLRVDLGAQSRSANRTFVGSSALESDNAFLSCSEFHRPHHDRNLTDWPFDHFPVSPWFH